MEELTDNNDEFEYDSNFEYINEETEILSNNDIEDELFL